MDEIRLTVTVDQKMWGRAVREATPWMTMFPFALVVAVAWGLGALGVKEHANGFAGFMIGIGLTLILLMAWQYASGRQSATKRLPTTLEYRIDDDTIVVEHPTGSRTVPWTAVREVRERNDLWLVFLPPPAAYFILPVSAFTAEQDTAFRALVARRTAPVPAG